MDEWLKSRGCDRHGMSPKPTRAILSLHRKDTFTALSPALLSRQAVLNFSINNISIKLNNQNKKNFSQTAQLPEMEIIKTQIA